MKPEIRERRLEMLNLFGKGVSESVVVTDTARKWGLKRRTVYQDWYRRGRWTREVAGFKDVEKAFWEMLFDLKQLANRAYLVHLKTDHPTAQVGALKLVADIKFRIADIMRELFPPLLGEDKEIKLSWAEPEPKVVVQMWKPLKSLIENRDKPIYFKDLSEGMKELLREISILLANIRHKPGEMTEEDWDSLSESEREILTEAARIHFKKTNKKKNGIH